MHNINTRGVGEPRRFTDILLEGLARDGGLFVPEAKETVEMMYELEEPFIVDSSRFESTFGMKATPMKEAIRETVAWYKSHPEKK